MRRFTEATVFWGLVSACCLAICPTRRSPLAVKATMDGVVRLPSREATTWGDPPSITATQEFVVPRSMPMIRPMRGSSIAPSGGCPRTRLSVVRRMRPFIGERGYLHPRRAHDTLAQAVAALPLSENGVVRQIGSRLGLDGLVQVRIEEQAVGLDGRHALPRERVLELFVDQANPLREAPLHPGGQRSERALEVVEDGQDLEDQRLDRILPEFVPLAIDPLSIVVEIRGRAEPRIVEAVALDAQDPEILERARQRLLGRKLGGGRRLLRVPAAIRVRCRGTGHGLLDGLLLGPDVVEGRDVRFHLPALDVASREAPPRSCRSLRA